MAACLGVPRGYSQREGEDRLRLKYLITIIVVNKKKLEAHPERDNPVHESRPSRPGSRSG
jgi:hypothetical protein